MKLNGGLKMSRNTTAKKGLRIIIVGCGKVGLTLTEQLAKEGHDITLIDKNAQKLQATAGMYDVMGVVGNGASYSVQEEAGIASANLIIAVTDSDELNLLCCTIAKRVGNCAAIARVRTPDYSREAGYLRERLGLAMIINPELETEKTADCKVRQGYLEMSNINVISEMVEMITISRAYESNQKAIQTIDSSLEKSVNLGKL
jgi:Trk K+ transport system NAD-binding subunit